MALTHNMARTPVRTLHPGAWRSGSLAQAAPPPPYEPRAPSRRTTSSPAPDATPHATHTRHHHPCVRHPPPSQARHIAGAPAPCPPRPQQTGVPLASRHPHTRRVTRNPARAAGRRARPRPPKMPDLYPARGRRRVTAARRHGRPCARVGHVGAVMRPRSRDRPQRSSVRRGRPRAPPSCPTVHTTRFSHPPPCARALAPGSRAPGATARPLSKLPAQTAPLSKSSLHRLMFKIRRWATTSTT
jgi:hypothetical protein